LKIAFIGHGSVGSVHARGLTNHPGVTLAAVFGPNRERAEAFAASHGVAYVGNTIAEAVSKADLAIVCSPSPLHYRQGRECLKRGVNTLLEIPPCETVAETEELETIAKENGLKLQAAHTGRYLPAYVRIAESIRRGELGSVQQVSYTATLRRESGTGLMMLCFIILPTRWICFSPGLEMSFQGLCCAPKEQESAVRLDVGRVTERGPGQYLRDLFVSASSCTPNHRWGASHGRDRWLQLFTF